MPRLSPIAAGIAFAVAVVLVFVFIANGHPLLATITGLAGFLVAVFSDSGEETIADMDDAWEDTTCD